MEFFTGNQRNYWLDAAIAFALGLVGQAVITLGLEGRAGLGGPVLDLLAPAAVGALAGVLTTRGSSVGGLAVGLILAFQVSALAGSQPVAELLKIALSTAAGAIGFSVAWSARQQQQASAFMPTPPSTADVAKMDAELSNQLRTLDPSAPGTFERASALLRQAGEQAMMMSPMGWPGPPQEPGRRSDLLRIQAELVEVARLSAIASGASRVTVSTTSAGIDIQAIWGDAPTEETFAARQPDDIDPSEFPNPRR